MTVTVKQDKPQNFAPLNALDNAFLLFEEEYHPMSIGNIWELDRHLNMDQVIAAHRNLMFKDEYRRYRQIPVGNPKLAFTKWVDVSDYDPKHHIFERTLPAPGNKKQLEDLVSEIFTGVMDRNKPLWECYLVQGAEGGNSMLVYRLHHALTDGQGSIRALLSVTTMDEDLTKAQYSAGARQNKKRRGSVTNTVQKKVTKTIKQLLMVPVYMLFFLYHLVLMAIFYAKFLFRPKTSFYRNPLEMNPKKRVGWSEQIDLEDVKFIKNVFGGTVNDVLVSCVSGALRSYLVATNQPVQELFCAIPVSMRRPDDFGLRNESTMIYMELPTTVADPVERMKVVHARTNVLKKSPAPYVNFYGSRLFYGNPLNTYFLDIFNKLPKRYIASRAHCVLTNVPGPQKALHFHDGTVIKSYVPFIPQHGAGALGMGVLSYNGHVSFGIVTEDDYLQGGPDDIARRFEVEFAELLEKAKALHAANEESKKTQ